MLQNQSFDAFGQRRDNVSWQALTGTALTGFDTSITRRGYTGHEGIDALGLIHMDGRVYDARLGRFLQADPTIDGVTSTQGFNRYSYVPNNPLNATDSSGFGAWRDLRDKLLKYGDGGTMSAANRLAWVTSIARLGGDYLLFSKGQPLRHAGHLF